ncbi:hypothetical protein J5N97_007747 [Dioscorea zingiberensis]|uniref:NAC domain-containing protein n=1 Tax=Dioscorea zingiberensis TaxID=325984 RepID=A0A9D5DCG9_9LILI|nr:hypothetical protein J5N97_007747 [Dioscorea zingiberensis]
MEKIGLLGYQLPPGFRFHPTDEELINDYLKKKITSSLSPSSSIIADINLYKYNPWDLPERAFFGEEEWFFFSPRDRKYKNGARPNRAAGSGYWKATGTDKPILAAGGTHCLGVKKALVFYKGRPPKGTKTDWVMHEYRLLDPTNGQLKNKDSMRLDDWVLCRIRHKISLQVQADDEQEHTVASHVVKPNNQKMEMQVMERERSEFFEGTEYEMFACLMNSEAENSGLSFDHQIHGQEMGAAVVGETKPFQQVLQTIKRKLSFGALDEVLMLPQSKRLNYDGCKGEQFSPFELDFVDQDFLDLLL